MASAERQQKKMRIARQRAVCDMAILRDGEGALDLFSEREVSQIEKLFES